MPETTKYEIVAQCDDEPFRRVEPRCVVFNTWPEAKDALERGLRLLPSAIFMVSRFDDERPIEDEPDLVDWPADRHVRTEPGQGGTRTVGGGDTSRRRSTAAAKKPLEAEGDPATGGALTAEPPRACEGGATTTELRDGEWLEACQACPISVRHDLVVHWFFGFRASCPRHRATPPAEAPK